MYSSVKAEYTIDKYQDFKIVIKKNFGNVSSLIFLFYDVWVGNSGKIENFYRALSSILMLSYSGYCVSKIFIALELRFQKGHKIPANASDLELNNQNFFFCNNL